MKVSGTVNMRRELIWMTIKCSPLNALSLHFSRPFKCSPVHLASASFLISNLHNSFDWIRWWARNSSHSQWLSFHRKAEVALPPKGNRRIHYTVPISASSERCMIPLRLRRKYHFIKFQYSTKMWYSHPLSLIEFEVLRHVQQLQLVQNVLKVTQANRLKKRNEYRLNK